MGPKDMKCDDLVIVEFLKEARILKRQLGLMKHNIDQVKSEDLSKVLVVLNVINKEIEDLRNISEVKFAE